MKKVLLCLIFSFLIETIGFSQNYCTTNNWDWWSDNTQNNWTFKSADQGIVDWMGSIWTGPSRNVLSINRILVSEDYTPKNGWILVYKDFGCNGGLNNPYFILYNKYRGKLRIFTLLYNLDFGNGGMATMRWADPYKTTSLLTHGTGMSRANLAYHSGTPISTDVSTSTTDKISNSFYSDKWFVADFDVAFDHLTPTTAYDYQLSIDISAIQNSNVTMSGELNWITEPYSPNIDKMKIKDKTDENGKSVKDYLTDARKITKNIPSESDLKKVFGDQKKELFKYQSNTEASFGKSKISERYELTMTQLEQGSEFVNFLTSVSKYAPIVGKYIDVGIGVFDFLSSKPNTSAQKVTVMPTVTHGSVSLSGTIRTDRPIEPIIIGLPGTKQSIQAYEPYYNCPLGVIGLEKEPKLSIRKWSESRTYYSALKKRDDDSYYVMFTSNTTDKYKSIRANEDLKIAINAKADVEVVDIKAGLCGRIRKKTDEDKPAYAFTSDLTFKEFYDLNLVNGAHPKLPNPYKFKWATYLNDNFYELTSMDESGYAEFSTPLVDIQNFKGLSFTVREETDVYLIISATLKAKDSEVSSTPIVFAAKYKLTEPTTEDVSANEPYPFSEAQLVYLDITNDSKNKTILSTSPLSSGTFKNWDITNSGNVLVDAKTSKVTLTAYNSVKLLPGFSAKLGGSNSVLINTTKDNKVIAKNFTPISNLVKSDYFADCNSGYSGSPGIVDEDAFVTLLEEAENAPNNNFSPYVYPNPVRDLVNIGGLPNNSGEPSHIRIFDSMGKQIISKESKSGNISIDLSGFANGLFLINISNNKLSKVFKVFKE